MTARRGFSLVELIIVVGVLALLVSLGSFLSATYLRSQYLRSASETVVSELRRAQTDSLTQADDHAHGIRLFEESVVRYAGDDYASRTTSLDVETPFSSQISIPGTDEISIPAGSSGPSAAATMTLERNGRAIDINITPYGVLTISERAVGY